ncbi:hypothetical protein H310_12574 [Aphanomyces invadans]|nr:hypothetical protein H310_12574 [Aphanomyces invadans]ETV93578.1 hypothetical protein H310_12574 [Aphanomyces invadans]|eukprot:XP_008877920.1 hypothetical protein H310_12574 [Aphanomyces invadans]
MTPTQVFGRCPIAERDLMWTARPDLWLSSARTFAGVTRADAARVMERMARLCEMSDYAPLDASRVGAHLKMFRSGGHDDLEWHIGMVYALEHHWVAGAHPLKFTAFKERMKAQYPGWVVDVGLTARRGDETMLEYISSFVSAFLGRGRGGRHWKWPTATSELAMP